MNDKEALNRICATFKFEECAGSGDTTVRLEVALDELARIAHPRSSNQLRPRASELLLLLADSGNAASQYRAAKFYQQQANLDKAGPLYEKSSQAGYGIATYELGVSSSHFGGRGGDNTIKLYELAMQQGYDKPVVRAALASELLFRAAASDCPRIRELLASIRDSNAIPNAPSESLLRKLCGAN
jgi:hypothetical protein